MEHLLHFHIYDRNWASLLLAATQAHRRVADPLYQALSRQGLGSNQKTPAEGFA